MLLFGVIIFFIVSLFYVFISKYNIKKEYALKDIDNNTITRIRGNYIDITYNGESVRIIKEDGKSWYYKKADDKKELKNESVFKVGDREFVIVSTEKRDGRFILIPLTITMITISALLYQTNILMKENGEKEEIEKEEIKRDEIEKDNLNTTIAIEPESIITNNEEPSSMNENDLQSNFFKEDINIDWESFQEEAKQRRILLSNPSEMGIQVSKYQGDIEWEKVKADGIDYAIIQAGSRGYETGRLNEDPNFKKNKKNQKKKKKEHIFLTCGFFTLYFTLFYKLCLYAKTNKQKSTTEVKLGK